ncbi:L-galactonate dehydratase [Penicillium lagena]|uniref:L-galactonate dehydratase n=1 Tax=Penicillium lagena TaxID=94218 RepID=UPI0025420E87|nr:L-galactonate dehydratase [Penicillium lagena]KAJ5605801.1 L-galactonate dehydratase [Penicillium lagena]
MVDVNQSWDVEEITGYIKHLSDLNLCPRYGIGIATGKHINNRVMFKQLLQVDALDAVQLDACRRLTSVNEILIVLLMSAKFGVPVVPHFECIGLAEICSHISTIDFVAVSGKEHPRIHGSSPRGLSGSRSIPSEGHHVTLMTLGYSCDVEESVFVKFECPSWNLAFEGGPNDVG